MSKIVVIGSSNVDSSVRLDSIPLKGQTIIGGDVSTSFGGKGANQAVAAKRLGGDVAFITKLGADSNGVDVKRHLLDEGLPGHFIISDNESRTGQAWIAVEESGDNAIIVLPGANLRLSIEDIRMYEMEILEAEYLLLQLEIPMAVVEYVAGIAAAKGVKVILNPAPACSLSDELLKNLYAITPNEHECAIICGGCDENVEQNAGLLVGKGVRNVIVTLGSKGSCLKTATRTEFVPAKSVCAVDTTAAGDTYNGALCVALSKGKSMLEAMSFATEAAAISVTRSGAQTSIPYLSELTNN
ncbi:MAG: ribokinase [Candidatus Cryptobacteroides sp.]